jgi:hypothetical protein
MKVISVDKPLVQPGRVVATPGAVDALAGAGQSVWSLVARHIAGDWGGVDAEDAQANAAAVRDGSRVLSSYRLTTGVTLWVVTEAKDDRGHRASTCVLLPEEY